MSEVPDQYINPSSEEEEPTVPEKAGLNITESKGIEPYFSERPRSGRPNRASNIKAKVTMF